MTKIEDLTHRALGFYVERANVLLANMGNRDTPGYTPVDLEFHQTLRDMVNGVPAREDLRLPDDGSGVLSGDQGLGGELVFDPGSLPGENGNSVDLDREVAKMTQNNLAYQAAVKILKKKHGMLSYAISGGR